MEFFDKYDRFYATSETSPFPHRLNGRYDAIIEKNKPLIEGAKVLDIASHDGRWSFAALQAGAAFVKGVEARSELINNAEETFSHYGISPVRYSMECKDIFSLTVTESFDIVFCLGFFYHTIRHAELLDLMDKTGAKTIIIDTEVTPLKEELPDIPSKNPRVVYNNPYGIQLIKDKVEDQQMAVKDSLTRNGYTLAGRPSRAAMMFMSNHFGYTCTHHDWKSYFTAKPERASAMVDYSEGWRETFYLSKL